ncbi:Uncharacterized protein OS=Providencia rettgeri DSM 1131 GN=PROVRETT_05381 PE=4 SV=1 [Gemmata massiliana]|uniref:Uncharacterized protein n=1 Tax=Gemmata massiliana TaxID=1210884 RepID=A0A6P2D112_9BACT|nr:hypothetical protein [Gemmata massiliana]VTR93140.1 Uncharacterized protein OS=Providencia rettgeri DSM 1131 GN=PROVRETT_05381 PE=4 SV=1 [Gemmata massiliana]
MGYDVHIHRADDWHASESRPISAAEWMAVVDADPELRPDPDHEFFALWPGPCRYPGGTWFAWSDGEIHTKNPDRAIVAKMLQIARELGARVQGDHGEFYNRSEDMPSEEQLAELHNPKPLFAHPWLVALGCLLTSSVLLFVFGVGALTIWRWLWG